MPRIRTVKPDFFRHEKLQDLESANYRLRPMLVFAGLWGHCDKAGRFEWRPRQLKLDILPFLNFEMSQSLELLEAHGFIRRYTVDGNEYGCIQSFSDHQRIGGKEAQEPEKYPDPPPGTNGEALGKQPGSNGEAPETAGREGKGREKEGNGVGQRSRGSRLCAEWQPSEILKAWAVKKRPDLDIPALIEKFHDHWASVPGGKGVKLDWEATFRNFVRNEHERPGSKAAPDYSAVIAGLKD